MEINKKTENLQAEAVEVEMTDKDIFKKIWLSPRSVFKYINDNEYDDNNKVLLVLAGISLTLARASSRGMGDDMSLIGVLAACIIIGGLLGWLSFYIYAAMLSWTGSWLKGEGYTGSILRMTAYAMLPSMFVLILIIPQIIFFGNTLFQSEYDFTSYGSFSSIMFICTSIIEAILGVWSFVLFVIGLSEVQKFSIVKSIINILLPLLIIVVPVLLLVCLI